MIRILATNHVQFVTDWNSISPSFFSPAHVHLLSCGYTRANIDSNPVEIAKIVTQYLPHGSCKIKFYNCMKNHKTTQTMVIFDKNIIQLAKVNQQIRIKFCKSNCHSPYYSDNGYYTSFGVIGIPKKSLLSNLANGEFEKIFSKLPTLDYLDNVSFHNIRDHNNVEFKDIEPVYMSIYRLKNSALTEQNSACDIGNDRTMMAASVYDKIYGNHNRNLQEEMTKYDWKINQWIDISIERKKIVNNNNNDNDNTRRKKAKRKGNGNGKQESKTGKLNCKPKYKYILSFVKDNKFRLSDEASYNNWHRGEYELNTKRYKYYAAFSSTLCNSLSDVNDGFIFDFSIVNNFGLPNEEKIAFKLPKVDFKAINNGFRALSD